jgi:hypothetical protein
MNLGSVVSNIRCRKNYVSKRADLESIGFEFDTQKQSNRYELVRVALLKNKDINCHLLVPCRLVVPANDITWPKETWGMKLGTVVMSIRQGKSCVDKRAELESIGFYYRSQSRNHGYELIKVGLNTYKDINGDLLVPTKFVVPTGDIIWPEETWGMNLGYVLDCIKCSIPLV